MSNNYVTVHGYHRKDDECPNCGASIEENVYETVNEFYEPVMKCASCGVFLGYP